MAELPSWLLVYMAVGLVILALIVWRAPQVFRAPAGGRVVQSFFVLGLVVGSAIAWPFPLLVALCQGWRIARSNGRAAGR